VAQRDGHTDPALLAALQDPTGLRRAVAVEVLSLNGRAEPRGVLRKLLDDPAAAVRLRAALALADAREARAVSTLIALLGEPSTRESRVAEEYLQALAGEQGPKVALGDDAAAHVKCRDAWTAWWTAADGPALLADLVKSTGDPAVRDKALALIAKLGDESFDVRQQAAAELKGLGSFVVPYLRKATTNPDVEIRTRAATCLADLEKPGVANLAAVNFRLLALRRPAGAPAALLAYLPMAEDEAVVAEAQAALDVLAVSDGVADPEVVKALNDPTPIRRAAAAEALLSQSGLAPTGAAARLLKDPDAGVRLKAALALAGNRDRAAVPVLIALLTDLPPEQTIPVEDYLRRLAGDKPPLKPNETVHDADKTVRAKRRDAWAAWWTAEGANVQLPERLANPSRERYRGYTLLVQMQNGEVTELDASGKTRWTISGLVQPFDAQVLPGDRVLIAEFGANRVTERNLKGEILWEKAVNWPTNVRRLPGGGTFIAARAQILELDRSGKEVLNLTRPNDVMSAQKLRDGRIAVLSNRGNYQILDAAGKELKSFNVTVASYSNEVTPKGGVIVPVQYQNKVTEYDADGKTVWEATVNQPTAVARLPNGNTLVASEMGPVKLIEFDRAGKQVAETSTPNYTNRISRR
jgi:HEAT repeat protein